MDYSIVIPVFNREDLTRQCLATLPPTLDGAGIGETIVVDNGSRPETAAALAEFPWVRVIRNERNLGFAAACNQGTRAAQGRFVVHLNNDTVATNGWLAHLLAPLADPGVGITGAKLLFPDGTIQHAGVVTRFSRLGADGIAPYHLLGGRPGNDPGAAVQRDFDIVTGACLAMSRALYLDLGGFDETYWNGYEDVDLCLKVRARGLRVVYEPRALLTHFESQSGVQRKRRVLHNIRELSERWNRRVDGDDNAHCDALRAIRREEFVGTFRQWPLLPIPPVTIVVHGPAPADPAHFHAGLHVPGLRIDRVLWCAAGSAPPGIAAEDWQTAVPPIANGRRGDRYLVFVDTRTRLRDRWLYELINSVEAASDVCAAAAVPPDERDFVAMPLTADGRCSIVALRTIPRHVRLDPTFPTLHGAVAAWIDGAVALGGSIRAVYREGIELGAEVEDAIYEARFGRSIALARRPDPLRLETLERPDPAFAPFASIVTLSWNAPEYTEIAIDSIRKRTTVPYEIIIVDNGSSPETLERIRKLAGPDLRIIENERNMGFAHGCNQGMAAARGTHVVLLNNDVVVTDGWLESLLEAHRRDPSIGISAPRSNRVAGHQQIDEGIYKDLDQLVAFAAERSSKLRGVVYPTDRVIGFCMCISRNVVEEVGGIDTRYDIGNFEDDDYCVRVRAAGYRIVVCEDSFIHHFGNVSFNANNVDYRGTMAANWRKFAERWQLPPEYPTNGYTTQAAIARGFDPARDHFPLPDASIVPAATNVALAERAYALALHAYVAGERDWNRLAPLVGNFLKTFDASMPVRFAIGVGGALDARTIGDRVLRSAQRAGIDDDRAPDVDIVDVDAPAGWMAAYGAAAVVSADELDERSPSALRRLLAAAASPAP